jgi:predicted amidophosphoribosyltransferase
MRETDDPEIPEAPVTLGALLRLQTALNQLVFRDSPLDKPTCNVCQQPIALEKNDICSDENGKTTHSDCYVKRIISAKPSSSQTEA